jgi:DNA-binding NarL/FixJ family response regulator
MSRPICVLIIASSGPFRDGLRILLQALPDITQVDLADTLVGGWRFIHQQPPDAIVVDADLLDPDLIAPQLEQLKTLTPHSRQIIIVHTQLQQRQAHSAGLLALLAGFTAEDLFASIFI